MLESGAHGDSSTSWRLEILDVRYMHKQEAGYAECWKAVLTAIRPLRGG
jgi:hypothetical protein